MKIGVVGTGYVGLVTGTCFAEAGNDVTCIDIDTDKIKSLQAGQVPIYEKGLEDLFKRNQRQNRLHFTTALKQGVLGAEAVFLALPTPPEKDGSADLSYILGVAEKLGHLITRYTVIVDKSTVPIGTAEKVRAKVAENTSIEFDVVSNPEFLREGRAVDDFQRPDRIVIGTSSDKAFRLMKRLYKPFVRQGNPIFRMDERSAEMTKYAANAMLAARISFINEIANLSEVVGADIGSVQAGIGSDERIGRHFLYPGPGYGGSCFPKDVEALQQIARQNGYDLKIVKAISEVNNLQKQRLTEKLKAYFRHDIQGKTIALWGLAFKPGTDDIREAPSLDIIESLTSAGAKIVAFDPEAMENVKKLYHQNINLSFAEDEYSALENADALVIVTDWDAFKTPDFERMKRIMKKPVIFDGRNLYDLDEMQNNTFYYESIGRRVVGS